MALLQAATLPAEEGRRPLEKVERFGCREPNFTHLSPDSALKKAADALASLGLSVQHPCARD